MVSDRVNAFRDCLLNTCVQLIKIEYPDIEITLSTCMEDDYFTQYAYSKLHNHEFEQPIEPAMEEARQLLFRQLNPYFVKGK